MTSWEPVPWFLLRWDGGSDSEGEGRKRVALDA